jgi:hypothetical protein
MWIAVEHVLRMSAAEDTPQRLLEESPLTGAGRHSSLSGLRTPIVGRSPVPGANRERPSIVRFLLDVRVSSRSLEAFLAGEGHDVFSPATIDPAASDGEE